MEKIYFITGNENKFSEAKKILPVIEQLEIDLPEVQGIDSRLIIEAKLLAASEHHSGAFVVEDTSLELECLNGLPGPLIKWFEKKIGNDGLVDIAKRFGNPKVVARTVIGFKSGGDIRYFEGSLEGQIVESRGDQDFGWGPIFQPSGFKKTFGELSREEKNSISMRKVAFEQLKRYLSRKKFENERE